MDINAEMNNRQCGNVGNLGDILKHAALTRITQRLHNQHARFVYVDSHAFVWYAGLANKDWGSEIASWTKAYPAYQTYLDLQSSHVENGRYLCSLGIVSALAPHAVLHACEKDETTRHRLLHQLAERNVNADVCEQLSEVVVHETDSPLLVLVDPFRMDDDVWNQSRDFLIANQREKQTVVMCFDCHADAVSSWRPLHASIGGPVATMDQPPYHLAVYASADCADWVAGDLMLLGWTVMLAGLTPNV